MKTLVTGGIRSGKSAYAEGLLGEGPFGAAPTVYLATGATRPEDSAWAARVEAHQKRRPSGWTTQETIDVAAALHALDGSTVLLDDLGHWLSRTLDELGAWESPDAVWCTEFGQRRDQLLTAIETFDGESLVIVTGEVGFGLVSPYESGRLYTDELGHLNQRVAELCDSVVLVVAGCPLTIKRPEDSL